MGYCSKCRAFGENNINGTYKTLIGGVQMTLESWMREIREYNRTGKKQLDIPNVGEIHKLLRKKGRGRMKLFSSSPEICSLSAALPPLPQISSLCPLSKQ